MSADDHLGLQWTSTSSEYSTLHYAMQGDNVVAHASVNHPSPYEPRELAAIRVGDDYQGHGLGHQMLDHVIAEHGHETMTLRADPFGNKAMSKGQLERFYGSHGFTKRKSGAMVRRPTR
jgi:GNAT superfamily N-acetyltransferase